MCRQLFITRTMRPVEFRRITIQCEGRRGIVGFRCTGGGFAAIRLQQQMSLPPAKKLYIHGCKKVGINQRAMKITVAVVDFEAAA